MTGQELQQARLALGVAGAAFAQAFDVSERTLRGWESGKRAGKPVAVPKAVAILARLAFQDSAIRRELGLTRAKNPQLPPRQRKDALANA